MNTPTTQNPIALFEQHKQPFITSLVIAEQLRVTHQAVLKQIKRHFQSHQNNEWVGFKILPFATKGGIQKRNVALLNHEQVIFLLTIAKNTPRAVEIKANIAAAFARFAENTQVAMTYTPVYGDLQGTLKTLAEYTNPDNADLSHSALSMRYNDLINKACGIAGGKRDVIQTEDRANIARVTSRVCAEIIAAMQNGVKPKAIYKRVRREVAGGA